MLSIATLTLSFSSTPSDKGCFNYYSGSCYCEGDANDCGVGHTPPAPPMCVDSPSCDYDDNFPGAGTLGRLLNDGDCDDGGPGSDYDECDYGTDCSDCGPRPAPPQPPSPQQLPGFTMPTFYTGTSKYCSHCPNGQGCWDGAFAGGPEHCTCVTEDKCVKNSPAYVSCSDCGADGNPPLKELPQPANAGCFK